jgi:diguanylate cyclase (GGDEF)-like protein
MEKYHSFIELKRALYLWILPFIVLSSVVYNVIQTSTYYPNYVLVTRLLIPWFILCWILLYSRRLFRLLEYANLILFSLLHIAVMYDSIHNYMAQGKEGAIGITIIWTPLIFIYIFITLRGKSSFYFSIGVFLVTLMFGLIDIKDIHTDYMVPLFQFYLANIVYIVILFFTRYLFKVYMELEVAKRNAYLDFLTGIANRHQIDIWLDQQIAIANDSKESFSIIFFDLDHFKMINDRFGHKVGDSVLVELVQLIRSHLTQKEYFGRWGGEEFIIITERSRNPANELAERLRTAVGQHDFKVVGKQTASFGVTEFQSEDTEDTILSRVDTGLYNSKTIGRDQVTLI